MKHVSVILLALAVGLGAAGLLVQRQTADAAAGPCTVSGSGLDSEESQFLGLLQQWRNQNVASSTPLEVSGALNLAAAWYAQWQVDNGGMGGHMDSYGRDWRQRAADCGYDAFFAMGGSGEGTYALASSGPLNVGPAQALAGITYPGSGVRISSPSSSWPAKCVGLAVKRNAAGTRVAWVAVIAQFPAASPCPAGSGGGPEPSPTSTTPASTTTPATSTPTSTPTRTPTPTPTPSPTPTARADGTALTIVPGWNLVVIPPGQIDQVLYRAKGCFRSVYQPEGDGWLRYSPDAPPYANNLQTSNGGVFWVEGTAANCGRVPL